MLSQRSRQTLGVLWVDLPAVQAGLFVCAALVACLLRFGFFVMIVAGRFAIEVTVRRSQGKSAAEAWQGALRANLLDIALLLVGIDVVLYTSVPPWFVAASHINLAIWTVLAGMALLIPKLTILLRFARTLAEPLRSELQQGAGHPTERSLSLVLFMIAALLLLPFSGVVLPGGFRGIISLLRRQLTFWKL